MVRFSLLEKTGEAATGEGGCSLEVLIDLDRNTKELLHRKEKDCHVKSCHGSRAFSLVVLKMHPGLFTSSVTHPVSGNSYSLITCVEKAMGRDSCGKKT